ncbi:hypothetical protein T492DRAFT_911390 [Pavlovales sp. CCMP2436]|nr:hypothetical protein T492DRAFT_911390 [Pavlovales sp. CCMP2436]
MGAYLSFLRICSRPSFVEKDALSQSKLGRLQPLEQDLGNHTQACAGFFKTVHTKPSRSMSLHNLAQQKVQRRDTLAATQAQKDAAKAQREQKKQDEAVELESKHVLCEIMCACGVVPCEVARAKWCPTCRTIAESDRAFGKVLCSAAARKALASEAEVVEGSGGVISSLGKDFERVKKQRLSPAAELIDKITASLLKAQSEISSAQDAGPDSACGDQPPSVCSIVAAAAASVEQLDALQKVSAHNREVQAAHAKFCKSVDKALPPDVEPVMRLLNGGVGEEAPEVLHREVARYLFSEGYSQPARLLLEEAGLDALELEAELRPYEQLRALEKAMDGSDLGPALEWTRVHRAELAERQSELPFALHRLRFLQLLLDESGAQNGTQDPLVATEAANGASGLGDGASGVGAALAYGRTFLAPSSSGGSEGSSSHSARVLADVQQLMGALLYAGRLESSPYAHLLDKSHWATSRELLRSAGALPFSPADRLPVEIELPRELLSCHSIITCPVSREQCTRDNPPMLLPCGHVISHFSLSKLSRGCRTARFKCPYCPAETTTSLCRQVFTG